MNLHLRTNPRTSAFPRQTRQAATSELTEILLDQSEQIEHQQKQLNDLGKGFRDIAEILQKQQKSNPTPAIEEINQSILSLSNAIISLHQQLKKADFGQGFAEIKAQQQSISKAIATSHKSIESQSSDLGYYLGWKRIMAIVVSTAVISSLSNVAIGLLAPSVISQFTGKGQPEHIEKVEPVLKKRKGNQP